MHRYILYPCVQIVVDPFKLELLQIRHSRTQGPGTRYLPSKSLILHATGFFAKSRYICRYCFPFVVCFLSTNLTTFRVSRGSHQSTIGRSAVVIKDDHASSNTLAFARPLRLPSPLGHGPNSLRKSCGCFSTTSLRLLVNCLSVET